MTSPSPSNSSGQADALERIGAIPVEISVELGRARLSVSEVLKLVPGSVIELSSFAGDELTIHVNGVLVAKGEAVVLNDHFGIRVTNVIAPADRARSLGQT